MALWRFEPGCWRCGVVWHWRGLAKGISGAVLAKGVSQKDLAREGSLARSFAASGSSQLRSYFPDLPSP